MPHLFPRRVLPALFLVLAATARAGGLDVHADAKLEDIGLPLYPGATRVAPDGDPEGGFTFGLWGSAFGLHMYSLEFHSGDGLEAVAAYYRDALARYGTVIECPAARPRAQAPAPAASAARKPPEQVPVACDDDDTVKHGGHLYKAGTRAEYRSVRIEPRREGVHFQLVHLATRGMD